MNSDVFHHTILILSLSNYLIDCTSKTPAVILLPATIVSTELLIIRFTTRSHCFFLRHHILFTLNVSQNYPETGQKEQQLKLKNANKKNKSTEHT